MVTPDAVNGGWREQMGVVLSVGHAALFGGAGGAGVRTVAGVAAGGDNRGVPDGAGTAITVAALATMAVTAKGLARRVGGIDNPVTSAVIWWAELVGAVAVLAFGILLLIASV